MTIPTRTPTAKSGTPTTLQCALFASHLLSSGSLLSSGQHLIMLLVMTSKINCNADPAKATTELQEASMCSIPQKGRLGNFPHRLFSLLESTVANVDDENTVAWTKDGMAFDVFQPKEFMKRIGSKWFPGQSTYRAFERQLNNWGFRMMTFLPTGESSGSFQHFREGPASGVRRYWHPCFCRHKPHLRRLVQRHQVKSVKSSKGSKASPTVLGPSKLSPSPESVPLAGPIMKTSGTVVTVSNAKTMMTTGCSRNWPQEKDEGRTQSVKESPSTSLRTGMGHGYCLQSRRPCPFTDRIDSIL